MAITVVIGRDDVGAPSTREVYAQGVKFNVDGGDLSILSSKPQLLALYGSGNWLSVHVDDYVEVVSEKDDDDDGDSGGGFGFGDDELSGDDMIGSADSSADDSDPFGVSSSDDDPFGSLGDASTSTDDDPFANLTSDTTSTDDPFADLTSDTSSTSDDDDPFADLK